jgi:hypothetical protein
VAVFKFLRFATEPFEAGRSLARGSLSQDRTVALQRTPHFTAFSHDDVTAGGHVPGGGSRQWAGSSSNSSSSSSGGGVGSSPNRRGRSATTDDAGGRNGGGEWQGPNQSFDWGPITLSSISPIAIVHGRPVETLQLLRTVLCLLGPPLWCPDDARGLPGLKGTLAAWINRHACGRFTDLPPVLARARLECRLANIARFLFFRGDSITVSRAFTLLLENARPPLSMPSLSGARVGAGVWLA